MAEQQAVFEPKARYLVSVKTDKVVCEAEAIYIRRRIREALLKEFGEKLHGVSIMDKTKRTKINGTR